MKGSSLISPEAFDAHVIAPVGRAAGPGPSAVEERAEEFLARLEASLRPGAEGPPRPFDADAVALDALAFSCARGGGAFEVAVGDGLDLLARTGGDVRLGYSGIGDLARERLGIAAAQARRLRRNAAALRERPLLRAAVLRGEVSPRKAEVVFRVARGPEEAFWVEKARTETLRRLEAAAGTPEHAEDDWRRIRLGLPSGQAHVLDVALDVAKLSLGPTAPLWKQLWALAAEFLSEYPIDPLSPVGRRDAAPASLATAPSIVRAVDLERRACVVEPVRAAQHPGTTASAGASPESMLGVRGAGAPMGVAARGGGPGPSAPRAASGPADAFGPVDPYAVLARLERLIAERASADEHLGRTCRLVKELGVARRLGYACFEVWCAERLGVAPSTVYQRVALERRMAELPELRDALRSRRLSFEQVRLVARFATRGDVSDRIAAAAGKPCVALAREGEADARLQMRNAGELRAVLPDEAEELLGDAIRSARLHARRPLTPGEALVEIALHFVFTWKDEVLRLVGAADPVILRDEGLCTVPGCSRPADHVHHVRFRSAGGPREPWNETSLCAVHHLRGVHAGNVAIAGAAPDGLAFVLGEREVRAARA